MTDRKKKLVYKSINKYKKEAENLDFAGYGLEDEQKEELIEEIKNFLVELKLDMKRRFKMSKRAKKTYVRKKNNDDVENWGRPSKNIDVEKARELRAEGIGWRTIADELDQDVSFMKVKRELTPERKDWKEKRAKVLKRDSYMCQECGSKDELHVHHIIPIQEFDDSETANKMANLLTLCKHCHPKFEPSHE